MTGRLPPRNAWRNELAEYHAGRAKVVPQGKIIDGILAGQHIYFEFGDQNPRRVKRIIKRLLKMGLLKIDRGKPGTDRRTRLIRVGPHVPARGLAKSMRKEKRGRRV